MSVAAAYIKETFPTSLKKPFGAIYASSRVFGILVCYTIAEIFDYKQDEREHISVYFGLSYLAIIQAILVYFYLPHSPVEMMARNNEKEFMATMEMLYRREDVGRVVK
jgi:hypothetical protein